MSVRVIEDRQIRLITLEHRCEPDSGGGATFQSNRYFPDIVGSYLHWQDDPALRLTGPHGDHCNRCGEKLPRTVKAVQELIESQKVEGSQTS